MSEETILISRDELMSVILGYSTSVLRDMRATVKEETAILSQIRNDMKTKTCVEIATTGFRYLIIPREKDDRGECFVPCKDREKSLGALYPKLAKEWDEKGNGGYTAFDILPGSHYNAHWRCKRGHRWQAEVSNRTRRGGCPYCAGRIAIPGKTDFGTLDVALGRHWDPELNEGLDPKQIPLTSRKEVWWKCDCGNVWKNSVYNESRNLSHRCRECKRKSKFAFPE